MVGGGEPGIGNPEWAVVCVCDLTLGGGGAGDWEPGMGSSVCVWPDFALPSPDPDPYSSSHYFTVPDTVRMWQIKTPLNYKLGTDGKTLILIL